MGVCGSAAKVNPDRVDISHFEIVRVLGQGGFGKVKAVVKLSDVGGDRNKMYAMKMLNKKVAVKRQMTAEIFNERAMLSCLKSPFLCNARYCFQDEWFCFIVMDLCLGGDLGFRCKRADGGRIQEDQAKFYAVQLVCALEYLHSQRIVHRDLKPDNVVLTEDGMAKLTDFGLAKVLNKEGVCEGASGTYGYMAPEIFAKKHRHGIPSDWFALGATIGHLISGVSPFSKMTTFPRREPRDSEHWSAVVFPPLKICDLPPKTKAGIHLVRTMCVLDPAKRLMGAEKLRAHPWFLGVNWDAITARTAPAPFIPDKEKANFEVFYEDIDAALMGLSGVQRRETGAPQHTCEEAEQDLFQGYEWNTDISTLEAGERAPPPPMETLVNSWMDDEVAHIQHRQTMNQSATSATPSSSMSIPNTKVAGVRNVEATCGSAAPGGRGDATFCAASSGGGKVG